MAYRPTTHLRLRRPDSCCETCRLVDKTNEGLLGRRDLRHLLWPVGELVADTDGRC